MLIYDYKMLAPQGEIHLALALNGIELCKKQCYNILN